MLETRPIIPITIGYIIGIILGLYIKFSIALFYFLFLIIYFITRIILKKQNKRKLRLISFGRCIRYLKIIFTKKVILIIALSSIISNEITIYQNNKYKDLYKFSDNDNIIIICKIVSNCKEKEYKDVYKIKIETVNKSVKYKNTNLYLYVKKTKNIKFKYGEIVKIEGTYKNAEQSGNYKGFDYKEYLKTLKIYGIVNLESFEFINNNKEKKNIILINNCINFSNNCFLKIKNKIESSLDKNISSIVIGLTLGFKDDIDENIKQNFSESNLSYILAISGMHIGYIVRVSCFISNKVFGKTKSKIFTCIILLFYMFITGFYPSVVRAGISAIIVLLSRVFHRKSDTWSNLCLSLLIILIYNPFLIRNIGVLLSFGGTLGILVFYKNILNWFVILETNYKEKNKHRKRIFKLNRVVLKFYIKLKEAIALTISANLAILPIIVMAFNKLPITSIIICSIVNIIIGPIIIICFLYTIVINFIEISPFNLIINFTISSLINIAQFSSKIIFIKIYIIKPYLIEVIIYYLIIFISNYLFKIYHTKNLTITQKRIRNVISLIKYRLNQNKQKIISLILILILIFSTVINIPKNLKIYFINVGQGDCTFILTPKGKTILVDGGGSEFGSYDVGKNTLLPYLLNRRVRKLDYIIISHFDSDHVGGLFTIMEELKVDQVIISKQEEDSENYKKFKEIVKEKKIKVIVVSKGDTLEIENHLCFKILWPNNSNLVLENALNNNSIVCKLYYKDFSMLFTGDIEEIAEKQMLQEYQKNLNILNSTILKVAHHGSKTSSKKEFLDMVKPVIALIGVGKDNKFGHPNDDVIKRLESLRCKNI